jgi:1-acyl-sn-glycerol-3-phosphate acyltransferase
MVTEIFAKGSERAAPGAFYGSVCALVTLLLRVFFRMRVSGGGPIEGPFIVIANHESVLDGFVVASAFRKRRLTFLSASYLYDVPIVGPFLRAAGALPVQEQGANVGSLRRAIEILKDGGAVALFPEGGIAGNEILGGAVYLALKTRVPILPLRITGTREALPPGRRRPSLARVRVSVGAPLCLPAVGQGSGATRQAVSAGKETLQRLLSGADGQAHTLARGPA